MSDKRTHTWSTAVSATMLSTSLETALSPRCFFFLEQRSGTVVPLLLAGICCLPDRQGHSDQKMNFFSNYQKVYFWWNTRSRVPPLPKLRLSSTQARLPSLLLDAAQSRNTLSTLLTFLTHLNWCLLGHLLCCSLEFMRFSLSYIAHIVVVIMVGLFYFAGFCCTARILPMAMVFPSVLSVNRPR